MCHSDVWAELGKAAHAPSWASESIRVGSVPSLPPSTEGSFSPRHLGVDFPIYQHVSEDFPIWPARAQRGLPGEARIYPSRS